MSCWIPVTEEYISKQTLEDALIKAYKHQLSDHDAKLFVEFMAFVDDLPSVTPIAVLSEQKKGRLLYDERHNIYVCSECGYMAHVRDYYCSNCGAEFESEEQA